jgi:excinuclease ABC subunit A
LISQLQGLVDAGHSVVLVEHDMRVAAQSDWIIDMGPGAGEHGGRIVAAGPADDVAMMARGATAPFLRKALGEIGRAGVAR